MFDIGFPEFFLAAVVALLVIGPERLPGALRTAGLWLGRLRRSYYRVKTEIEREIGMDDVRRQLHNEQVMADVRRVEREVQAFGAGAVEDLQVAAGARSAEAAGARSAEAAGASPPTAASSAASTGAAAPAGSSQPVSGAGDPDGATEAANPAEAAHRNDGAG